MKTTLLLKHAVTIVLALACSDHVHAQQKPSTTTSYVQLSDVVHQGYKGRIKETTVKEYDRAVKKNGVWQPEGEAHEKRVGHFDKNGFLKQTDIFMANKEQDIYVGKIVYSRKGDTVITDSYNDKGELVLTNVVEGNDPLGYTSWQYNSAKRLTEQDIFKLDQKYRTVNNRTITYDSTGKAVDERNIARTYSNEGAVEKVTAVRTYPGYTETDTIITRNTILKKDAKGNGIMTLRKEAGQQHYMLFFTSFVFYDE